MSFAFNFAIDNDTETDGGTIIECKDTPVIDVHDNQSDGNRINCAEEMKVDWVKMKHIRFETENISISSELSLEVVSSNSVQKGLGTSQSAYSTKNVNESKCSTERPSQSADSVEKTNQSVHGGINQSDTSNENISQSALSKAFAAQSDLLPHVYEGGLKIWECSIDLTQYLSSLQIAFRGCHVLELGCGAGLPGLYTYIQGAHVTFQDYNAEVLSLITAPNILLSHHDQDGHHPTRCRLVAGDWSKVQEMMSQENIKFDYILTSETIYSSESYKKLHDIMKVLLKPTGVVYLAAKTHYFGVGGGTREFEQLTDREGCFQHTVCRVFHEGVQREILKLTPITS